MVAENCEYHLWHQDEIGARFIEAEKNELGEILPKLYGYHLLFVGDPGLSSLTQTSLISHQILLNPYLPRRGDTSLSSLRAEFQILPVRADSVDVVVLAHTLEHTSNPHEVLRETHRVLIPEGHIVITGFNPISPWGIWHTYKQYTGKMPRQGKMLTANRVKDWLHLLNFHIVSAKMFYFRPPCGRSSVHEKLSFLENWGQKYWPFIGGAYALHAIKRVVPLTPLKARWRPEKAIWQPAEGLPKPTSTTIDPLS